MVIKFKTDGSVEKNGFRASWRTEDQTCGGDMIATSTPQVRRRFFILNHISKELAGIWDVIY